MGKWGKVPHHENNRTHRTGEERLESNHSFAPILAYDFLQTFDNSMFNFQGVSGGYRHDLDNLERCKRHTRHGQYLLCGSCSIPNVFAKESPYMELFLNLNCNMYQYVALNHLCGRCAMKVASTSLSSLQ